MPDIYIQWAALIGMIAIGVVFISEVRKWRSLSLVIRPKHRKLRIILLVLFEILFLMIYIGPWLNAKSNPLVEIAYWSGCILLGIIVILIGILDLRAITRGYVALNQQILKDYRQGKREDN